MKAHFSLSEFYAAIDRAKVKIQHITYFANHCHFDGLACQDQKTPRIKCTHLTCFQRFPDEVNLGGRRVIQSLVNPFLVVKLKIGRQACPTLIHALV